MAPSRLRFSRVTVWRLHVKQIEFTLHNMPLSISIRPCRLADLNAGVGDLLALLATAIFPLQSVLHRATSVICAAGNRPPGRQNS